MSVFIQETGLVARLQLAGWQPLEAINTTQRSRVPSGCYLGIRWRQTTDDLMILAPPHVTQTRNSQLATAKKKNETSRVRTG